MIPMRRRSTSRRLWAGWYLCSILLVLASLNFSAEAAAATATTPSTKFHAHSLPCPEDPCPTTISDPSTTTMDASMWRGETLRGGSTMMAMEPPAPPPPSSSEPQPRNHDEEPDFFEPPKVELKHVSMALRLTSEWNRRLQNGVNRFKRVWGRSDDTRLQSSVRAEGGRQIYGQRPVNIRPTRSWHPPITDRIQEEEEELTLFHAKAPRESYYTERRGVARWGPDLLPYLEHVVQLLGVSDGVEIPLAMIYLDRACSVETPRSNGVPPCPFCTPRTVHRLSLAALILAKQAIDGRHDVDFYYDDLKSLGIPLPQLQQMVDWMKAALGDAGPMVTVGQMKNWSQSWDSIFFPERQQ